MSDPNLHPPLPLTLRTVQVGGVALRILDEAHPDTVHGGNKVRKLVGILDEAAARGATDLLTFGAVGSHHVLATALWGARRGMATHAVLIPQPETEHVRANAGRIASACASWSFAPRARDLPRVTARVAARLTAEGRRWMQVPPGGSSVAGTAGWSRAAAELPDDHDEVVVASGSGGTAAGLLAGRRPVRAVRVGPRVLTHGARIRHLGRRAAERAGLEARAELVIDQSWLAGGYGVVDGRTREALAMGREAGLPLESTYSAKALACALDRARQGVRVLFVQTASGAPLASPGPIPDVLAVHWRQESSYEGGQ